MKNEREFHLNQEQEFSFRYQIFFMDQADMVHQHPILLKNNR